MNELFAKACTAVIALALFAIVTLLMSSGIVVSIKLLTYVVNL
jgi:hypothetical protein